MEVKIIRSSRRLRTISGRLIKDILVVQAPVSISEERLDKIIAGFKVKFQRKRIKQDLQRQQDLSEIAAGINKRYFADKLKVNSIEYVTNQDSKFGCCNFRDSTIRISHKVGLMPVWVRDYVVLHEMAHLAQPNHSKAFWDIVYRYKLTERARGYLMACGVNSEEE